VLVHGLETDLPDTQRDFVFRGKVRVWTLDRHGKTIQSDYEANQYIEIPPYTPHIFEFLQDAVIAEWWDGPFASWFYEPYRKLVQQSLQGKPPGQFTFLVKKRQENQGGKLMRYYQHHANWISILLGVTLGYVFGRYKR
jgi:hypothetical protein